MSGAWCEACSLLQLCLFNDCLDSLHSYHCHTQRVQLLTPAVVSLPCAWAWAFWVACRRCCSNLHRWPLVRSLWTLIHPLPMHSHLLLLPQAGYPQHTLTAARNTSVSTLCRHGRTCVSNCKRMQRSACFMCPVRMHRLCGLRTAGKAVKTCCTLLMSNLNDVQPAL